MSTTERYRKIFLDFKRLCAEGQQPCSFRQYCLQQGVDTSHLRKSLGEEYQSPRTIPGYRPCNTLASSQDLINRYTRIYEGYKELCSQSQRPGSYTAYCISHGVSLGQMYHFMHKRNLKVTALPGYFKDNHGDCCEIPFEDVIFEEAGFLPAGGASVITVSVDGHVAVSFPADTDVDVIARFIRKMGKEGSHVES